MNKEIKELQEDINGKEIVYVNGDGDEFNAIMIFPPDGKSVAVKPYGYTDDELVSALESVGYDSPRDYMTRPEFCFAIISSSFITTLKYLAIAPINSKIQLSKIKDGEISNLTSVHCPYGG